MGNFITRNITRFFNLLFFLLLVVFWRFFYDNHLLQKEQMQLFLVSWDYLFQHLCVQGGLAIYLGEFITQFFLNSWSAALLVAFVLLQITWASQKVLIRLFGKQTFPLSYLPAIGYTFVLLNPYYEFSGSIGFALSIWSVYGYLQFKKPGKRILAGIVFLVLNYWFFGASFLLFTASVISIEILCQKKKVELLVTNNRVVLTLVIYLALALLLPLACYKFILTDHLLSSYMSRAYYQFSLLFPAVLVLLLVSFPAILLYSGFVHKQFKKHTQQWLNNGFSLVLLCFLMCGFFVFPNFEEEKEMQFDNLVAKQQWNDIISLAEKELPTGNKGKLALSLALAKTGEMSEQLFRFESKENDFFIPFTNRGQAANLANEPYFYLGLNNFAKMLCFENIESTPNGKMPVRMLKRLVETYIIDGQYDVAERYLWQLKQTLFYRNWAENAQSYLNNDQKLELHPLWGKLRNQKTHDDFYFQYERNDVALLTLLRSNQQNKLAYEYLMSWYLLRKDFDEFLKYLPLAETMDYDGLPLHFQEALVYVKTLFDEVPDGLEQYKISTEVQQNLNRYAQVFQQGGSKKPAEMKKQFGNTYWYYIHFIETADE